jgi:two-component system sensor histidine kinase VicK
VKIIAACVWVEGREFVVAGMQGDHLSQQNPDTLEHSFDVLLRQAEEAAAVVMPVQSDGAERVRRSQARFVADASHDLRTPLTVMRAELDLLRHSEHDARTAEALERIDRQSRRLDRLASDLLLLAALDASGGGDGMEKVDARWLVDTSIVDVGAAALARNIYLDSEAQADVLVRCIPHLLRRAIANVLDNAIMYSPDGAVVRLRAVRDGDRLVVIVTDQGAGVPMSDLPHVFDRLYRSDVSRSTPGHGLGLSIVRSILDVHKGTIHINTSPGYGTVVSLSLPL